PCQARGRRGGAARLRRKATPPLVPAVLHVGPPDTGGPVLQGALRAAREDLAKLGVRYFGPARMEAARQAAADRIIVSNEALSDADGFGAAARVVITVRPLAAILPLAWQRSVLDRLTDTYDEWLDEIFNRPTGTPALAFWANHGHGDLVERWASVVG